jgi:hypothetical protein
LFSFIAKLYLKLDTLLRRFKIQKHFKLVKDSIAIAKNVIDGKAGLTGLNAGPKIDGVDTAYTAIDTLTIDNKQHTYDLIFKTGYKDETSATFSNIDFAPYKS